MDSYGLLCIVDDDADYRFLVQQVFSRFLSAYPMRLFPSGKALLDELPQMSEQPNLILLDRHMPDLDGHQTLLYLKQQSAYQKIPVVMMSAHASLFEIEDCYKAGVNSFLFKKSGLAPLKDTLSAVCQYWLELNREPLDKKIA
ncbi:response regulator [Spirosoma arcticum]